jgi:capsular polysaccharide transport system permease protein
MEVLPISAKPAEEAAQEASPYVMITRHRRFPRPDRLFLLVVGLPLLVAILYFGFLASNVYVSESKFVVRSPEKPAQTGLGVILKTAGFTNAGDELYAAQSYATSRDALRAINRGDAFKTAYTRPQISIVDRFNPFGTDGSFESLYNYFRDKVALGNDSTSSISTLTVRAYTPEDARKFNEQLLELSESTVNRLNQRGRLDLVHYAESEVADAKDRAQQAAVALAAYRNRSGVVDPEKQAEAQMQMISKLQDDLIAGKTELAQLQRYTPQNPRIPVVRTQLSTIQRELDEQLGRVAGSNRSLAATAVRFQRLQLENEFAAKQLASALASLEEARSESSRKQAYVERIVEPNLPDSPSEPRRLRGIFATLVISILAYGILKMLLAGVREHAL